LEPKRLERTLAEKFSNPFTAQLDPQGTFGIDFNRARLDPKALYTALKWDVPEFLPLLSTHRALEA